MTYVLILGLLVPLMSACDVTLPVADLKTETGDETVVAGDTDTGSGTIAKGEAEIDISDWQTYRNEEYGFEVKYPGICNPDYQYQCEVAEEKGQMLFYFPQSTGVIGITLKIEKALNEYPDRNHDWESPWQEMVVNGTKVIIGQEFLNPEIRSSGERYFAKQAIFLGSEYSYKISVANQVTGTLSIEQEELFDAFVSNFRLIEQ